MIAAMAVAGAGRMGRGIAHVFAYAGYRVALVDIKGRTAADSKILLSQAEAEVARTIGLMESLGQLDAALRDKILARVSYHPLAEAEAVFAGADLAFEAVPEVLETKESAFELICRHLPDDAIVSSTTSTMLVDTLAEFVTGPERFLNAHWLNPAFLVPLVEVSPGAATAPAVVERLTELLQAAGKEPVVCAASPGFIVPRIQTVAMNEAVRMAEEGVASPEDIDHAIRVGFGVRYAVLGLLEFLDWGGVDILDYAGNYMSEALGAERFKPPPVIGKMIAEGRSGMREGQGFYDFRDMDVEAYQRETIAKFVDLVGHLGLLPPPSNAECEQQKGQKS